MSYPYKTYGEFAYARWRQNLNEQGRFPEWEELTAIERWAWEEDESVSKKTNWQFTDRESSWTQVKGPYQVVGFFTEKGEPRFNLIKFSDPLDESGDFEVIATGFLTLKGAQQFIGMKFKPLSKGC